MTGCSLLSSEVIRSVILLGRILLVRSILFFALLAEVPVLKLGWLAKAQSAVPGIYLSFPFFLNFPFARIIICKPVCLRRVTVGRS